jgi:hypothetical protein
MRMVIIVIERVEKSGWMNFSILVLVALLQVLRSRLKEETFKVVKLGGAAAAHLLPVKSVMVVNHRWWYFVQNKRLFEERFLRESVWIKLRFYLISVLTTFLRIIEALAH